MKKQLLSALTVLLATCGVKAQTPFAIVDSININNINADVTLHGDMWWAHCNFPVDSPRAINFTGGLWMSGYDDGGQLHIAAQTYRQHGIDYWPGPLDAAGGATTYATSFKWAKIWKVNRTDIQAFQALPAHNESNTLPAILTWPGKGNTYSKGNGGYSLSITTDMAPFKDLNGNGIYEPLNGEYPDIKGDQALWWVFNDNGVVHNQSNDRPLGMEVHAMVYGYKRGNGIDDIIYYDYDIINRSPNTYNNFRVAVWDDVEIGYYLDDYAGFDSTHRMGIAYNSTDRDGGAFGNPIVGFNYPPVTGLSMIVAPGDAGGALLPPGSFIAYNNEGTRLGNPASSTEFNYYMRARWRDGAHLTNIFNGPGIPCGLQGTGAECNYLYPGDPSDASQWSECSCVDPPGDRLFVLSSGDITFTAGTSQHLALALIAKKHAGGCERISFAGIKALADTAWDIYHNPLPSLQVGAQYTTGNKISIYPNPARNQLFIEDQQAGIGAAAIAVYNSSGQKMSIIPAKNNKGYTIDISGFPPGIYYAIYTGAVEQNTTTFVKE